jgi:hypothetical protein
MASRLIRLLCVALVALLTILLNGVMAMEQVVDDISDRQQFHPAQARQEPITTPSPTSTVDFSSMPTCGISNCVYPTTTQYPCATTYPSPCPSGGPNNCSTVSLDCYCNLATPYQCAFHPCSWTNVMLLEIWFNKTCPEVDPTVNYDYTIDSVRKYVPSCALSCLRAQTINYGCTSESLNCFCSHESLYGCTARCSAQDNSTLADWLAATCQLSSKEATDDVLEDTSGDSSAKVGGPTPPSPPKPLHWYEIMPIAVFATSAVIFLTVVISMEVAEKRR